MSNQSNNFSYVKPNGKRALRAWVWATLAIVLVVVGIIGYSIFAAQERQAEIIATPRPAATLAPTSIPTLTPAPTVTPTVDAGATSSALAAECPSDSTQWTFTPVAGGVNYDRIDPPCVYDGLDKVIGWIMAFNTMGWDAQTSLDNFNFSENPWEDSQPKMDFLPVTGNEVYAYAMTWFPFEQQYQGWYVVNNSAWGSNFVVEGCYPTYNLVDGQKKYWSSQYAPSDYTTICMLSMDALAGWQVNEDGGRIYSRSYVSSGGDDLPAMFGYNNVKHAWYFFGFEGPGVLSSDKDTISREAQDQAVFNSPLWNLDWIEKQYGIFPKPLPDNWQKYNSQADQTLFNAKIYSTATPTP